MPTPRRTRAAASNSIPAIQAAMRDADRHPSPPFGCQLKGRAEHEFWRGLMSCRAYVDWTAPDLATAYKATQLETQIRTCADRLAAMLAEGADPCEPGSVAAKYAENLGKLRSGQLALFRSLGLTHQPKRTATSANAARTEREMSDLRERARTDSNLSMLAL